MVKGAGPGYRRDGADIQRLRKSVEDVVPIMGLAVGVTIVDKLEDVHTSDDGETFLREIRKPKMELPDIRDGTPCVCS